MKRLISLVDSHCSLKTHPINSNITIFIPKHIHELNHLMIHTMIQIRSLILSNYYMQLTIGLAKTTLYLLMVQSV